MARTRTGARAFLDVLRLACKYSRMQGFKTGLDAILGSGNADDLITAWNVTCDFIDVLVAADNWYNQKDRVNDDGAGEDTDEG